MLVEALVKKKMNESEREKKDTFAVAEGEGKKNCSCEASTWAGGQQWSGMPGPFPAPPGYKRNSPVLQSFKKEDEGKKQNKKKTASLDFLKANTVKFHVALLYTAHESSRKNNENRRGIPKLPIHRRRVGR